MSATTAAGLAELRELASGLGYAPEGVDGLAAAAEMAPEHVPAMLGVLRDQIAARDALRARLTASPLLRVTVCPGADWLTAWDRYDLANRALKLIEAAAMQSGLSAEEVAVGLCHERGTIAEQIEMHGDDPRDTAYGRSFYAMRYRLADAVQYAKRDELARIERERRAAQDTAWAVHGLTRCDRCGGAGGAKQWPGFTCYDCEGRGAVPAKH